jgi:hypothetical protein
MAARDAVAQAKPKAARATEVGEDPRVGRCKVIGPGEEGGCRRLSWAKKDGRAGRYGGLRDEKSRKRERLTGGLPRIPGQTDFGLH